MREPAALSARYAGAVSVPTAAPPAADGALADLRAELDGIDDRVHDLLMRRSAIVQRVAERKAAEGAPGGLRPGREAAILRRLIGRHRGTLPPATIVRIWRELLAGSVAIQGAFAVSCGDAATARTARGHFGLTTPLQRCAGPDQALEAVRAGAASVAVLPAPAQHGWWCGLAGPPGSHAGRLHIIARLPFWAAEAAAPAYLVAAGPPDPSGDDRSLILWDAPPGQPDLDAVQALDHAGFGAGPVVRRPHGGAMAVLADVAGFVGAEDPRLRALSPGGPAPVLAGAYACPIRTGPANATEGSP